MREERERTEDEGPHREEPGTPPPPPDAARPPAAQATEFCQILVREISVAEDWQYVQDLIAAILRVKFLASSGIVTARIQAAVPIIGESAPDPREQDKDEERESQIHSSRTVEDQVLADQRAAVSPPKHLSGSLAQEWRRCDREKLPCSVLSIAMDNYSDLEVRRGRSEASACLKSVTGTVRGLCMRRRDRVFHRSNGTFVAVLPRTYPDGARTVADRIAHGVRGLGLVHPDVEGEPPVVTVSVGVAGSVPSPDLKAADILRQADQILEAALRSGRGRVLPEFPRTVHRIDLRRFWSVLRPGVENSRRRRID